MRKKTAATEDNAETILIVLPESLHSMMILRYCGCGAAFCVVYFRYEKISGRVRHMVLYFSGTGNSAYVAEQIALQTGDQVVSINDRIREHNHEKIVTKKPLVFVTPTYAWRLPRLVEEWIRKMTFDGNPKAYFVMTCGDGNGNAQKYIRELCLIKQFEFMGCRHIVMPENYIAMFPVPAQKEARAIIRKAKPVIRATADAVRTETQLDMKTVNVLDRLLSSVVYGAFYVGIVKDRKFYAADSCIGCGRCEKVCPLHNIALTAGKPVWKGTCTHCMACISECPEEAIEYGTASIGKPRYRCPE